MNAPAIAAAPPAIPLDDNQLRGRLAAKLVKIQEACEYVSKDKANSFHNYRYASAEAVLKKVNPAMVAHGVASFPVYQTEAIEPVHRKDGTPERLVTVTCNLHIIDAETGFEIVACAYGSGQDIGDKAVMKAQTAALKYSWMGVLNIATGDDPEADPETDKRNAGALPIAAPQRASEQKKDFSGSDASQVPANPPAAAAPPSPVPPAAPETDTKLRCKCNLVAAYRKGISKKTGNPYEGYFCPKKWNDPTNCQFSEFL